MSVRGERVTSIRIIIAQFIFFGKKKKKISTQQHLQDRDRLPVALRSCGGETGNQGQVLGEASGCVEGEEREPAGWEGSWG